MAGVPALDQGTNYGSIDNNWESVSYFGDTKSYLYRSIYRFDLRSFIGQSYSDATLSCYFDTLRGIPGSVRLARCTRAADWRETGVSWLNWATGQPWTTAGGDFDDVGPPAPIVYANPAASGWFTIQNLEPFVTDALTSRAGWLSVIGRLTAEAPGQDVGWAWNSKEHVENRPAFLTLIP